MLLHGVPESRPASSAGDGPGEAQGSGPGQISLGPGGRFPAPGLDTAHRARPRTSTPRSGTGRKLQRIRSCTSTSSAVFCGQWRGTGNDDVAQGLSAAPASVRPFVPARVFGQSAPSNMIQIAQIGCGRIARGSEFAGLLKHHALARFVAVCDLDYGPPGRREVAGRELLREDARRRQVRQGHDLRDYQGDAGRQEHRRGLHQHAGSLARAAGDGSRTRGQGHLPAEARVADHRRRPPDGRRDQADGPNLAARQPAALRCPVPPGLRVGSQRAHRQDQGSLSSGCRTIPRATTSPRCPCRRI